jgi:hypothetical protein
MLKNIIKSVLKEHITESLINQDGSLGDLTQDDINEILSGYIDCALWTEEERLEDESTYEIDYEDYEDMDEIEKLITLKGKFDSKDFTSFVSDDIDFDSKIDAYLDIKTFIMYAGDTAIDEAIDENGLYSLGMDIWLTRNGHGTGFFDRSYDNEEDLVNAARKIKSKDLYVGDDGKLYFS